ncbi:hypothetical protein C8R42DRAFT_431523 [Lentinula raphanica]|nr:hypothetical protein C8R42DRAFT_431523 [Lentinula raphanica]
MLPQITMMRSSTMWLCLLALMPLVHAMPMSNAKPENSQKTPIQSPPYDKFVSRIYAHSNYLKDEASKIAMASYVFGDFGDNADTPHTIEFMQAENLALKTSPAEFDLDKGILAFRIEQQTWKDNKCTFIDFYGSWLTKETQSDGLYRARSVIVPQLRHITYPLESATMNRRKNLKPVDAQILSSIPVFMKEVDHKST